MQSYGVEITEKNYKEKSTRELEHALDTCKTMSEDGLFSREPTILDYVRVDEAARLAPLIEKELESRKNDN